jgi:hypothetical protein
VTAGWIRIEVGNRWDAVALHERLFDRSSYLVKLNGHFEVVLPAAQASEDVPAELLQRIEGWMRERSLRSATLRLKDGSRLEIGG